MQCSTTLNQLFYNRPVLINQLLFDLSKYMLTKPNHQSFQQSILSIRPNQTPPPIESPYTPPLPPPPKTPAPKMFTPKQKDSLFWCLYIITQGFQEYHLITHNYAVKELEIKTQIANFVKTTPTRLKDTNYKITKAVTQEILSELLTNQNTTSFMVLLAACCFYNINIIIYFPKSNMMLDFISDHSDSAAYYVVQRDEYKKYSTDAERKTKEQIEEMKKNVMHVNNYLKPLRGMSYYKVAELEEMAKKLKIFQEEKSYSKKELYDILGQAFIKL